MRKLGTRLPVSAATRPGPARLERMSPLDFWKFERATAARACARGNDTPCPNGDGAPVGSGYIKSLARGWLPRNRERLREIPLRPA
jgi:hypothetical protein